MKKLKFKKLMFPFLSVFLFLIFVSIVSKNTIQLNKNSKTKNGFYVEMSPMGNVFFKQVPDKVITIDDNYNDILITLNEEHKLIATGFPNNSYWGFYKSIGIIPNIDKSKLEYLGGNGSFLFDRERLYALKQKYQPKQIVIHLDPYQILGKKGWDEKTLNDVQQNIGPLFANRYSRENIFNQNKPYKFYSIFELSRKVSQIYKKEDIIIQLEKLTNKTIKNIQSKLPPKEKRPKVALIIFGKGKCTLFDLNSNGFGQAQYKAIGAVDAFENLKYSSYIGSEIIEGVKNTNSQRSVSLSLDLEGLINVNPDIIIIQFGIYSLENPKHHTIASFNELDALKKTQIGQKLNAIKNDKIFPGGTPLQGPLTYLFQIEMAAKQIYPEIFGKWNPSHVYPKEEQLFDRNELKRILGR